MNKAKRRTIDMDKKWCQGESVIIKPDRNGRPEFFHGGVSMTLEEVGELLIGGAVPVLFQTEALKEAKKRYQMQRAKIKKGET
jgi:hypothetical protein